MMTELELNAFVDGEMADEERALVLEATAKSVALRAQLIELQQLKDLVRAGYQYEEDKEPGVLEVVN